MPALMLRYRAAAFFARCYAPELTMGLHTAEERSVIGAEPKAKPLFDDVPDGPTVEAEKVEPQPEAPAEPTTTDAAAPAEVFEPEPEPVEAVTVETADAVPTMEQKAEMKALATKAGVIKTNEYLVRVQFIKEGQSFRDLDAAQIDRCLKAGQTFLDEVAK